MAQAASSKKAEHTVLLEVGEIIGIADVFVITQGANTRQVRTIVDEIELQVRQGEGGSPRSVEGLEDLSWVLLDYGDVVVHVFLSEVRQFYEIERLYRDVPNVDWRA